MIRTLRTLFWQRVRRHDGEMCDDCGRRVNESGCLTYWACSDELWGRVMPDRLDTVVCARCFVRAAAARGIGLVTFRALAPEDDVLDEIGVAA